MTDQLAQEPETQEADAFEDAVVQAFSEIRPEAEPAERPEVSEEVAPPESPVAEAPSDPSPQEPAQAIEDEQDDEELQEARRVRDVLASNPELRDQIIALERGDAALIPRQVIESARAFQAEQAGQAPTPATPAPPEQADDFEDRFYSNPAALVRELREDFDRRLAEQEAFRADQHQARVVAENFENGNLLISTGEEWQSAHPELTETQVVDVVRAVQDTGLIRRYLSRHGDKKRAVKEALEAAYRMEFPQAAGASAKDEAIRAANRNRRAQATAASPRSGQRQSEERPRPRNRAERVQLTADLIREHIDAQQ